MAFRLGFLALAAVAGVEAASCANHGCMSTSCREGGSCCGIFTSCGRMGCCQDDFQKYSGFDKYAGSLSLRAEEAAVEAVEDGAAKAAVPANFAMISDVAELPEEIAAQYFADGIQSGTVVLRLTEDVTPVAPEVVPEEPAAKEESKDTAAAPKEEESKDADVKTEEPAAEKEPEKPKLDMEKARELPATFKAGTIIVALNSKKTDNAWQFLPKGKEAYFVKRAAAATSFVVVPLGDQQVSASVSHSQGGGETDQTDVSEKPDEVPTEDPAKKSADWTTYYIVFGVVGVVLIAGIVYFMLFAGGDAEGDETEEEEVSEEDDEQV